MLKERWNNTHSGKYSFLIVSGFMWRIIVFRLHAFVSVSTTDTDRANAAWHLLCSYQKTVHLEFLFIVHGQDISVRNSTNAQYTVVTNDSDHSCRSILNLDVMSILKIRIFVLNAFYSICVYRKIVAKHALDHDRKVYDMKLYLFIYFYIMKYFWWPYIFPVTARMTQTVYVFIIQSYSASKRH